MSDQIQSQGFSGSSLGGAAHEVWKWLIPATALTNVHPHVDISLHHWPPLNLKSPQYLGRLCKEEPRLGSFHLILGQLHRTYVPSESYNGILEQNQYLVLKRLPSWQGNDQMECSIIIDKPRTPNMQGVWMSSWLICDQADLGATWACKRCIFSL